MSGRRRPHPAVRVHGALSRGAFAVAVLVSLAVLFAPADGMPTAPAGIDKAVHLALFAALAVTGRWAGMRAPVLAGGLVLYAAASEVIQDLSPLARSGSVADLLADALGVLAGLLLWHRAARHLAG